MRSGCSLVILSGGLSRRMGRDKATLPAGDGTLIEHLARRLAPVVDEIIIAGGSDRPPLQGVRAVADHQPGLGPVVGAWHTKPSHRYAVTFPSIAPRSLSSGIGLCRPPAAATAISRLGR